MNHTCLICQGEIKPKELDYVLHAAQSNIEINNHTTFLILNRPFHMHPYHYICLETDRLETDQHSCPACKTVIQPGDQVHQRSDLTVTRSQLILWFVRNKKLDLDFICCRPKVETKNKFTDNFFFSAEKSIMPAEMFSIVEKTLTLSDRDTIEIFLDNRFYTGVMSLLATASLYGFDLHFDDFVELLPFIMELKVITSISKLFLYEKYPWNSYHVDNLGQLRRGFSIESFVNLGLDESLYFFPVMKFNAGQFDHMLMLLSKRFTHVQREGDSDSKEEYNLIIEQLLSEVRGISPDFFLFFYVYVCKYINRYSVRHSDFVQIVEKPNGLRYLKFLLKEDDYLMPFQSVVYCYLKSIEKGIKFCEVYYRQALETSISQDIPKMEYLQMVSFFGNVFWEDLLMAATDLLHFYSMRLIMNPYLWEPVVSNLQMLKERTVLNVYSTIERNYQNLDLAMPFMGMLRYLVPKFGPIDPMHFSPLAGITKFYALDDLTELLETKYS